MDEAVPAGDADGAHHGDLQVGLVGAHALALGEGVARLGLLVVQRVLDVLADPRPDQDRFLPHALRGSCRGWGCRQGVLVLVWVLV